MTHTKKIALGTVLSLLIPWALGSAFGANLALLEVYETDGALPSENSAISTILDSPDSLEPLLEPSFVTGDFYYTLHDDEIEWEAWFVYTQLYPDGTNLKKFSCSLTNIAPYRLEDLSWAIQFTYYFANYPEINQAFSYYNGDHTWYLHQGMPYEKWTRTHGIMGQYELLSMDRSVTEAPLFRQWYIATAYLAETDEVTLISFGDMEPGETVVRDVYFKANFIGLSFRGYLVTTTHQPRTYYVDESAPPNGSGTSWADAFNYLQDALDATSSGDSIYVAEGIYKADEDTAHPNGSGDREATFQLKKGVAVRGGYAGYGEPVPNARYIELYETILSGDLDGNDVQVDDPCDLEDEPTRSENSYNVVTGSYTDETTVLDGFTTTGGNANEDYPSLHRYGGGMHNYFGSPTVTNCTFSDNYSNFYGGGMRNWSGSPTVTNCTFSDNYSKYYGGGMHNGSGSPSITSCTFSNNSSGHSGGGMHNGKNSSPTVTNCIFSGNSTGSGGGMFCGHDGNAKLTSCVFNDNSAKWGGGIYSNTDYSLVLTNCIFSGNVARYYGGGIQCQESSSILTNCTFSSNSAGSVGGGIIIERSNLMVTNSILWENHAIRGSQIVVDTFSNMSVSYCNVQGGQTDVYVHWSTLNWGNGNINADPLFWDADGADNVPGTEDDNLRLLIGSPCFDAGDNFAIPSSVLTDLDGDPRIKNTTVDMGAYEGPKQGFLLSQESVTISEGGMATFTVAIARDPMETVEVTVGLQSGDPDITVESGATLLFGPSNYSIPQTVTLAASEDEDHFNGTALFGISSAGFVNAGVAATEVDNEPYPNILLVDSGAPGAKNGANWEDAFTDLQEALSAAVAIPDVTGLQIWVAGGIYKPAGPSASREASFQLTTGLAVKGGYAGFGAPNPDARDIKAFETILNGDLNGNDVDVPDPCELMDEPTRSENCYHVVTCIVADATTILDGFIITGGNANAPSGSSNKHFRGGGIFNEAGSLQISNCIFTDNSARYGGGGICNHYACTPTLINCTFIANSGGTYGGGLSSYHSNPTIKNCIFSRNSADHGGGAQLSNWNPTLTNCTFSKNTAYYNGGGVYVHTSSPTIINCTFVNNNAAGGNGGGICIYDNCAPTMSNSILWGNEAGSHGPEISVTDCSTFSVSYSNVKGGSAAVHGGELYWNEGNTDTDPLFIDGENGDYHLLPYSPCIDTGDPNYIAEPNETDLDGNPRVINNRIDMGAYESDYIEVSMKLTPQALNLSSGGQLVKAHFVLSEGFSVDDVDVNTPVVIAPFAVESHKIKVMLDDEGLVRVVATFRRSDLCSSTTSYDDNIEVMVIGRLTAGQYFYGTGTIRIINKMFEQLAVLSSYWLESDCDKPHWCGGVDINEDSVVNFTDFAMLNGCCFEVIPQ